MTIESALAYRKEATKKNVFGKHLYEMLDGGELDPQVFISYLGIDKKKLKRIVTGRAIPSVQMIGGMADILQLDGDERLLFYEKASLSTTKEEEGA